MGSLPSIYTEVIMALLLLLASFLAYGGMTWHDLA